MKLIVGLGNPGRIYAGSRHNVGFMAIKELSKTHKIALKKDNGVSALSGKGRISGHDVILSQPLTFMNLSSISVKALLKKYKVSPEDLLVICDDVDLEFGRLKIKPFGSSGGHRGLKSIISAVESQDFCRLRIGIDRPEDDADTAEYVLSNFTKSEREELKMIMARATECCEVWVSEGPTESMNIFNRRSIAG